MKNKIIWVLAAVIALTVPVLAQSAASDTLSALLAEVHQLRIAMERSATITPQIQLLGTRLSVQSERLGRAGQDHDTAAQGLEEISSMGAQLSARLAEFDARATKEPNQDRQRALLQEQASIMEQLSDITAREQRLRVREAQLAAVLGAEETQWAELNRRVDEVERSLAARQPR